MAPLTTTDCLAGGRRQGQVKGLDVHITSAGIFDYNDHFEM